MIKRMVLLSRRASLDRDAFSAHWAGPHAALAIQLPGVTGYIQNHVADEIWRAPSGRLVYPVDGIVELFFDDADIMAAAARSPAGAVLLPEDEERFLQAITLLNVTDEGGNDGIAGTKVVALLRSGIAPPVLADLTGPDRASGAVVNCVTRAYGRLRLPMEPEPPTALLTLWFDDEAEARRSFAAGAPLDRLLSRHDAAAAFLVKPLRVVALAR